MNKPRAFLLTVGILLALACAATSGITPTATPEPPTQTPLPTNTSLPTDTPPPPDTVAPTETIAPTDTPEPTLTVQPTVTPPSLPQVWGGFYKQTGVGTVGIQLYIETMSGMTFAGKMLWLPTDWYGLVITRMNGYYVQDFGDAFEQTRWSHHPDINDGIQDGTWLKWTETEMISGNWIFTMNGWYYGHIRNDGSMVGIYYFNATETTPASDYWELRLKQ